MNNIQLNSGNTLVGVPVTTSKFQGVTSLNQIEAYGLLRPSLVEKTTLKQASRDTKLDAAKSVRDAVQRRFDKARRTRAELYSAYIEQVEVSGQMGGVPSVTLYSPINGEYAEGTLHLPYGAPVVAIDGETQTEGRFLLRDRMPETGDARYAFTMYHGVTGDHAQQILHDYNRYAHPVSERQTAAFNHVGPLSKAVAAVLSNTGIPESRINRRGNMANKKTVAANVQIMATITGHAMGSQALERGAVSWFAALNNPVSQKVINGGSETIAAEMLTAAEQDPTVGKLPIAVWQIVGVLASQGRAFDTLDLTNGDDAWASTNPRLLDRKVSMKERLAAVAAAM